MTGSEFLAYCKRKFIRTDKDTEAYEAMTDTISLMRIKFNPETFKEEAYLSGIATVGDYRLGIPSDFGNLIGTISMQETSGDQAYRELEKISKEEFDSRYITRNLDTASNKNTGVPEAFCLYGEQFLIGPVPDKTTYRYYINYTTEDSADVTASTDPVPFTSELRHRNILRNGVLFELHDGLGNYEEASYYKALFLDGLNDTMVQESRNTSSAGLNVSYRGF